MAKFEIEFPRNLESAEAIDWLLRHNPYEEGTAESDEFQAQFWEAQQIEYQKYEERMQTRNLRIAAIVFYIFLGVLGVGLIVSGLMGFGSWAGSLG